MKFFLAGTWSSEFVRDKWFPFLVRTSNAQDRSLESVYLNCLCIRFCHQTLTRPYFYFAPVPWELKFSTLLHLLSRSESLPLAGTVSLSVCLSQSLLSPLSFIVFLSLYKWVLLFLPVWFEFLSNSLCLILWIFFFYLSFSAPVSVLYASSHISESVIGLVSFYISFPPSLGWSFSQWPSLTLYLKVSSSQSLALFTFLYL